MKKLLLLLSSILISLNSYGAGDEPILYSYNSYDFDNASKYTISNGDGDQFGCIMTQFIFSKEALNALKDNNKEVMDSLFLSDKLTAANILLYKDKIHWLDTDQYSKIQTNLVNQNFVIFESPNADVESLLFQLINKDDELIFRMKTPNNGSTLVCDFPFIKIEVDEEGFPIQTICSETSDNVKWNEDYTTLFLVTKYNVEPFTGKNKCSLENVPYFEENYKDGKQDGKTTYWYENGQKELEVNFKDGKQDGKATYWYENGQIMAEETYKDGKRDGKTIEWEENGQIWSEGYYKDNKKDGKWISWYENSQKKSEKNYKDDKKDGKWTSWYENSQKKSEGVYKDGVLDGKSTSWTENGQKQKDANYKDGKYDGKYTYWFSDDWIVEKLYKDGECISGC